MNMDAQNCSNPLHVSSVCQICTTRRIGDDMADNDPFSGADAYHAKARFYKLKDEDMTGDDDAPTRSHFSIHCGIHQSYNPTRMSDYQNLSPFWGPKKGQAKQPIIFHDLGDMGNRVKRHRDDGASTSSNPRWPVLLQDQVNVLYGSRRLKNCEKIPPFEAVLSPEQRRAYLPEGNA